MTQPNPSSTPTQQITLPGQAHTAEGPHDQTGMYVIHHAFRRDAARFLDAVAQTPVEAADTWAALDRRWGLFAEALHHHHRVEDAGLWPRLEEHARTKGSAEDQQVLADMEAEHALIDPALASVRTAYAEMREHPCTEHRHALEDGVAAVNQLLIGHLAHEERKALPMLQKSLTVEENAAFEKEIERAYPLRMVPFLLPWVMDGLPEVARRRLLTTTPPGYGLLLRLASVSYRRRERRAFAFCLG